MSVSTSTIMRDDSLAARLFSGHDYKGSLVGDSLAESDRIRDLGEQAMPMANESGSNFFDGISSFFASVPWVVYAVLAVILVAFLAYWALRNGLLRMGGPRKVSVDTADDIYEIDYDEEMRTALDASDYPALVRLVYLRTLRVLDENGRIAWRIYKTPTEYSMELQSVPFEKMTRYFLRVRYGRFDADRALYDQMCEWQAEVLKGGAA